MGTVMQYLFPVLQYLASSPPCPAVSVLIFPVTVTSSRSTQCGKHAIKIQLHGYKPSRSYFEIIKNKV